MDRDGHSFDGNRRRWLDKRPLEPLSRGGFFELLLSSKATRILLVHSRT
jgi:hypothetical protein